MFMFLAVPASTSVDMVADTPNRMAYTTGTSYAVSPSGADDDAELRGYWHRLLDGATIGEPLRTAPWGDAFGICTDKFGVTWMVHRRRAGLTPGLGASPRGSLPGGPMTPRHDGARVAGLPRDRANLGVKDEESWPLCTRST